MTIEPLTPQALAIFVAQFTGRTGEEDFGEWLCAEAHATGWLAAHFRTSFSRGRWQTATSGDKGFFDWVLMRKGRIIFAELKVGHNKLSPEQTAWFEAGEIPQGRNGVFGIYQDDRTEFHLWSPPKRDEILRVLE